MNIQKLKSHKCNDSSCKGRSNNSIKCFNCNSEFFAKCFGLERPIINKINENTFVQFICGFCQQSKLKRRSTSTNVSTPSTLPMVIKPSEDANQSKCDKILINDKAPINNQVETPSTSTFLPQNNKNNVNNTNVQITSLNESISNDISKNDQIINLLTTLIKSTNENSQQLNQKLDEFVSKTKNDDTVSSRFVDTISSDKVESHDSSPVKNTTIENIFKLVLKLDDKLSKVHSIDDEKKSLQQIVSLIDTKHNNHLNNAHMTKNLRNLALNNSCVENWSMNNESLSESINSFAGRPSLTIRQSIDDDILDLMKSSEKTTWDTLDILTYEIKSLKELIELQSGKNISAQKLQSPVINAINLDGSLFESDDNDNVNDLNVSQLNDNTLNTREKMVIDAMSSLDIDPSTSSTINKFNDDSPHTPSQYSSQQINNNSHPVFPSNASRVDLNDPSNVLLTSNATMSTPQESEQTNIFSNSDLVFELNNNHSYIDSNQNSQKAQPSANRELYVSKFRNHITTEDILSYIKSKSNLRTDDFKVFRLTKRNQEISTLSFVSFKIETSASNAEILLNRDFWPRECFIKDFVNKSSKNKQNVVSDLPKSTFTTVDDSFLCRANTNIKTK